MDLYAGGEVIAEVIRSGFVESRHHGSVVVLGPSGEPVDEAGDAVGPLYPRSSNKPLQATGMLRAGLRLAEPADLAQVCASHQGEPLHIQRVRAILAAAGLTEADLRCPPDFPLAEAARLDVVRSGGGRARVFMNCSGKHAGMLATCVANGWPLEDYRDPAHPLQVTLAGTVEDLSDESIAAVGVDGCGAPVFALSLRGLAAAFLRLVNAPAGSLERAVADAMRTCPQYVSGTGRDAYDTRLMQAVPALLSKGGAEGVAAVAVPGVGAVALKIDDGARRGGVPVLAAALRRLGLSAPVLDEMAREPVYGGGRPVGFVRSCW
jgi:L-asparaginase II